MIDILFVSAIASFIPLIHLIGSHSLTIPLLPDETTDLHDEGAEAKSLIYAKVTLLFFIGLSSFLMIWESSMRMEDQWASFIDEAVSYYYPSLFIILMVMLWGVDLQILDRCGLDVIRQDLEEHRTPREVFEIVIYMAACFIISLAGYSYAFSHGHVVPTFPLLFLYVACPVLLVLVTDLCYTSARDLSWRLVHIALPPWDVTPADILMVDIFTSLAKVFSDLACSICWMVSAWTEAHSSSVCRPQSIPATVILVLPFCCRLIQCLRKYFTIRGDKADLWNVGD